MRVVSVIGNGKEKVVYMSTLAKNQTLMKWTACILIPVILYFMPGNALFTHSFKAFLAVTIFGIMLLALDLVPNLVSAISFPVGYALLEIAPLETVLSSWTGTTAFVMLCGFWLAVILIRINLLDRIIYNLAIRFAGSFFGIALTIYIAGVIASFVTLGGHQVLILAFAYGTCKAMNLKPGLETTVLMTTALFTCIYTQVYCYYPPALGMLNGSLAEISPENIITWTSNLLLGLPMFFVGILGVFILCKIFGRNIKNANVKSTYEESLAKLGKMSVEEKKAIVIVCILLLFLITSRLHGIPADYGIIIAPLLFYLPGINVGTLQDTKEISYDMVFLVLGCMAIGAAGSYIGLGDILSAYVIPLLGDSGAIGLIAFVFIFCTIFNFMLTPFAIYAAFSTAFASIAFSMGINPAVVMITMILAGDTIFLPYEHSTGLMAYAFGMMSMKDFFKVNTIKSILQALALMGVLLPYWSLTGMLYI